MLVAKRSTSWQATPNNRAIATVLLMMNAPQPACDHMAEATPSTVDHPQQQPPAVDVLNQQTIQQSQDQDAENPQAEPRAAEANFKT